MSSSFSSPSSPSSPSSASRDSEEIQLIYKRVTSAEDLHKIMKTNMEKIDKQAREHPHLYLDLLKKTHGYGIRHKGGSHTDVDGKLGEALHRIIIARATRVERVITISNSHIDTYVRRHLKKNIVVTFESPAIKKIFTEYFEERYPGVDVSFRQDDHKRWFLFLEWYEKKKRKCVIL